MHKVELWIQAVKENMGKIFICSDVDIQFFGPTKEIILKLLEDKDLVIQRDTPEGFVCSGFFACRASKRMLAFFKNIEECMEQYPEESDQYCMNLVLADCCGCSICGCPNGVQWDYLPAQFFGGGTLTGKSWTRGMHLPVPKNIVLHHANWTVGIPNKIAQLSYVRKRVQAQE